MSLVQFRQRPLATSILDDFFSNDWFPVSQNTPTLPAVNVEEGEKAFSLEMAVPGRAKNDFTVELDQDVLSIAAEASTTIKENNNLYRHKEFNTASFKRAFRLPDTVDPSKIKATYIHGILRVELPKRKEALPQPSKRIAID